jgi:hypothetical protein
LAVYSIAGGHVEFEAPRTVVISGSTARPMPTPVLLENFITAKLVEVKVVNGDEVGPIGFFLLLYMIEARGSCVQAIQYLLHITG